LILKTSLALQNFHLFITQACTTNKSGTKIKAFNLACVGQIFYYIKTFFKPERNKALNMQREKLVCKEISVKHPCSISSLFQNQDSDGSVPYCQQVSTGRLLQSRARAKIPHPGLNFSHA
jgi:hypothetical protein